MKGGRYEERTLLDTITLKLLSSKESEVAGEEAGAAVIRAVPSFGRCLLNRVSEGVFYIQLS